MVASIEVTRARATAPPPVQVDEDAPTYDDAPPTTPHERLDLTQRVARGARHAATWAVLVALVALVALAAWTGRLGDVLAAISTAILRRDGRPGRSVAARRERGRHRAGRDPHRGRPDRAGRRVGRRPGRGPPRRRRRALRCCPASSTPTSTSTSPGAPSGRASRPRPAPRRPAASRRWSTCRSTASRRPRRARRSRPSARRRAGQCSVDVGFWGGVVPGNARRAGGPGRARRARLQVLPGRLGRRRVRLGRRGRARDRRCAILAGLGAPLLVHAELPGPIDAATAGRRVGRRSAPRTPRTSRRARGAPRTRRSRCSSRLCRETARAHAHRPPLGGERAAAAPRRAQARACRSPPRPARTTCTSPPRRSPTARPRSSARRRSATRRTASACGRRSPTGVIDLVASRSLAVHARAQGARGGDFMAAWGGIASLQLGAAGGVDRGARARAHARRSRALDVRGAGAARRAGRHARARSPPGADADLVVFDDAGRLVGRRRERVQHRHRSRPTPAKRCAAWCDATLPARRPVYRGRRRRRRATDAAELCYDRSRPTVHRLCSISRASASAAPRSLRNDEFFAEKENLLKPSRGRLSSRASTPTAASGWTAGRPAARRRRSRPPVHDWCVVRLGLPGVIRGSSSTPRTSAATTPRRAAIEARDDRRAARPATTARRDRRRGRSCSRSSPLEGDTPQPLRGRTAARRFTHLRLDIYPDGGVARLRVHGEVGARLARGCARSAAPVDLAALEHGGRSSGLQRHVLRPRHNLIMPGPGAEHGRRLGDPAPARPGPRLGDRPARRARARSSARRDRHDPLQGQRAGAVPRVEGVHAPGVAADDADRLARRCSTRRSRPHTRHCSTTSCAGSAR